VHDLSLTGPQIAALRLQTLGIVNGHPNATPRQVAERLLATQAQDFTASRWAIGSRTEVSEPTVVAAFDRGDIVRSWPMRGTVHITLAEDIGWLLDLTGVRALNQKSLERRWDNLGIDQTLLERAREVAVTLLRDGGRATRAEFGTALTEAGIDVSGQVMYHVVWYLAQTGTIVLGPVRGNDHELVLLDDWVSAPRRLTRENALRELVVRYLDSHGPASIEDMAWWSGLTKGDLRAGVEAAGDALIRVGHAVRGSELLVTADVLDRHDPDPASIRKTTFALAPFDEHLLGYANREDVLKTEHLRAVDPMRNGVFRATIVHGGQVVAIWKATRRARGVHIDITPLNRLSAGALKGAKTALGRWSAFREYEILSVNVVS
jgi:hypothetical protein